MKKGLIVVLLLLMLFLYASFVEPNLLITENKALVYGLDPVALKNQSFSALKIVQFTDTQLGPFYSLEQFGKAVERINAEKPDIIIFTGDLFDVPRAYESKDEALEILRKLDNGALKIAIFGNHDFGGGGKAIYEDFMAEAGFVVLINEKLSYKTADGRIFDFFGIDDGMLGKPQFDFIENQIEALHYNVLIIHEPDLYEYEKDKPFDLILSGHSHGGQLRLPFMAPIITPPLAKIYTNGYYEIDNARNSLLYVNTGLGNTKMRYRFGNIPKITVFTIE
ncbi:metallophosphoesterase [Fusibacter sp. 3D3]|uniref:metallophosphoesterase n=1 Tax=Fusibacter sp. 3D3 TaxID=1048380 RepID=UPI000852FFD7|nr:metallophosphoesterase [Fusibacter sp. 3D3]GAU77070.1 Ser/Thr protein phosphatase family protein [Fusibacter sp. 3D3]